jgi:hypothetical protein
VSRSPGEFATRERAWILMAATLALLAGGYGRLGAAVGHGPGVIGCVVGLTVNGLLYRLVGTAMSGRPQARQRGEEPSPPVRYAGAVRRPRQAHAGAVVPNSAVAGKNGEQNLVDDLPTASGGQL